MALIGDTVKLGLCLVVLASSGVGLAVQAQEEPPNEEAYRKNEIAVLFNERFFETNVMQPLTEADFPLIEPELVQEVRQQNSTLVQNAFDDPSARVYNDLAPLLEADILVTGTVLTETYENDYGFLSANASVEVRVIALAEGRILQTRTFSATEAASSAQGARSKAYELVLNGADTQVGLADWLVDVLKDQPALGDPRPSSESNEGEQTSSPDEDKTGTQDSEAEEDTASGSGSENDDASSDQAEPGPDSTSAGHDITQTENGLVKVPDMEGIRVDLEVQNLAGEPRRAFDVGERLRIAIDLSTREDVEKVYLNVVSIDPSGQCTLIFPNDYSSNPQVRTGRIVIPGQSSYTLQAASPRGTDFVQAFASLEPFDLRDVFATSSNQTPFTTICKATDAFAQRASKAAQDLAEEGVIATAVTSFAVRSSSDRSPIAQFDLRPRNPRVDDEVRFDGRASQDPDGRIVRWEWTFQNGDRRFQMQGPQVNPHFNSAGPVDVSLTVTDNRGVQDIVSRTISLRQRRNQVPTAEFQVTPAEPRINETVTLDATDASDPDSGIERYKWIFGDGRSAQGARVQHSYAQPGTFNVMLTVRDPRGANDRASRRITVLPSASEENGAGSADQGTDSLSNSDESSEEPGSTDDGSVAMNPNPSSTPSGGEAGGETFVDAYQVFLWAVGLIVVAAVVVVGTVTIVALRRPRAVSVHKQGDTVEVNRPDGASSSTQTERHCPKCKQTFPSDYTYCTQCEGTKLV